MAASTAQFPSDAKYHEEEFSDDEQQLDAKDQDEQSSEDEMSVEEQIQLIKKNAEAIFSIEENPELALSTYAEDICQVFDRYFYNISPPFVEMMSICQQALKVIQAKKPTKHSDSYDSQLAMMELYQIDLSLRLGGGDLEQRTHDIKNALKRMNPKFISDRRLRECRCMVGYVIDSMLNRVSLKENALKKWVNLLLNELLPKNVEFHYGEVKLLIRMLRRKISWDDEPKSYVALGLLIKKHRNDPELRLDVSLASAYMGAFHRDAKQNQHAIDFYTIAIETGQSMALLKHPPTVWNGYQLHQLISLAEWLCERVSLKNLSINSDLEKELTPAVAELDLASKCITQAPEDAYKQAYRNFAKTKKIVSDAVDSLRKIHAEAFLGYQAKNMLADIPAGQILFQDKKDKNPEEKKSVLPVENSKKKRKKNKKKSAAAKQQTKKPEDDPLETEKFVLECKLNNPGRADQAKKYINDIYMGRKSKSQIKRFRKRFFDKCKFSQGTDTLPDYVSRLREQCANVEVEIKQLKEEAFRVTEERAMQRPDRVLQSVRNEPEIEKFKFRPVKHETVMDLPAGRESKDIVNEKPSELPQTDMILPELKVFDYKMAKNPIDMICSSDLRRTEIAEADFSFVDQDGDVHEHKKSVKQEVKQEQTQTIPKVAFFDCGILTFNRFNQHCQMPSINPWVDPVLSQPLKQLDPVGGLKRGLSLSGMFSEPRHTRESGDLLNEGVGWVERLSRNPTNS
jgi:hypothetical protein